MGGWGISKREWERSEKKGLDLQASEKAREKVGGQKKRWGVRKNGLGVRKKGWGVRKKGLWVRKKGCGSEKRVCGSKKKESPCCCLHFLFHLYPTFRPPRVPQVDNGAVTFRSVEMKLMCLETDGGREHGAFWKGR